MSYSAQLDNSQHYQSINESSLTHVKFAIEGMSCQSCASHLEKTLNNITAINSADVNFASDTASVSYESSRIEMPQLLTLIRQAGFTAKIISVRSPTSDIEHSQNNSPDKLIEINLPNSIADNELTQRLKKTGIIQHWRLIVMLVCWLPFMVGMLGMMLGYSMEELIPLWLQFILATLVQFVLAFPYYKSAWFSLRQGMANMDVLVVLGTLTIWLYSTFVWLSAVMVESTYTAAVDSIHLAHHVYFESSVMILSFISLGKFLEGRTKRQSLNSLDLMMSLTPKLVEKQSEIGEFYQTDLQDIKVADVLRAKQGTRIATDGMVIEGNGYCNESHLTGESKPLFKDIGDKVLAGALVEDGSLIYRVHSTGANSKLGDMIQALREAQDTKAPIARLADKLASWFIPVVLFIAVLTLSITYYLTHSLELALLRSVAVLVVACPCALGLATPVAIVAGMGRAARSGILFKDAESLERASGIDTVVLDKTGTLTQGRPQLVAHLLMDKTLRYNEVLQFAASVEAHASHPFASALVNEAKKSKVRLLPVKDIRVIAGQGIQGMVNGIGMVKVGSPSWVKFDMPADIAKKMPKVLQSSSVVAVSIDDVPLGLFAFTDEIRVDAKPTVEALKNHGLAVMLISGDKVEVVDYVSHKLEINEYHAKMTPRNKADKIKEMQAKGKKVAMVGDGVNDAPALATADVSFAMIDGTDIAKHSASVRLVKGSLAKLLSARFIANKTVAIIKQNLFLAFSYNLIAIPLAAFGYLNPMLAAVMMSISSLCVLLNSLRLSKVKY